MQSFLFMIEPWGLKKFSLMRIVANSDYSGLSNLRLNLTIMVHGQYLET